MEQKMNTKDKIIDYLLKIKDDIPAFVDIIKQAPEEKNTDVFIEIISDTRTFYFKMKHHIDNEQNKHKQP